MIENYTFQMAVEADPRYSDCKIYKEKDLNSEMVIYKELVY